MAKKPTNSVKTTFFVTVILLLCVSPGLNAETCTQTAGRLVSMDGSVEVQPDGEADWHEGQLNAVLCEGDTIRVGEKSRAAIMLVNEAVLRLDEVTTLRLVAVGNVPEKPSLLDLLSGALQSFSRAPRTLSVNTPYINGLVEGTEFLAEARGGRGRFAVFEGRVRVANALGSVSVTANEEAEANLSKAPAKHLLVKPRDAVQWTLFYPPVLVAREFKSLQPGSPLALAVVAAGEGNRTKALQTLQSIKPAGMSADAAAFEAALLLDMGRVDAARLALDHALRLQPGHSAAQALRAVIALVADDRAAARVEAEHAMAANAGVAASLAFSYVQQAAFDLKGARATLHEAVARLPAEPLLWSRLSEVELMLGEHASARTSAQHALNLDARLPEAHRALGFSALAAFRIEEAQAAFAQAISASSSDPLAHLGHGLATIAKGDLAAGRRELETAVALDGNNALLRAYLGKAYFEEKRSTHAAQQFSIAKKLDPADPTAWLYDGLRRQSENAPVAAMQDLHASIVANDHRAVYRSRLLLDKDRAARGASLARVYRDLGFTQLGVREATRSMDLDPANASAHRFLSDSYQGIRRREIARVSELLQAQLLQDINVNPLQPSVAETNLNIFTAGGPAAPGFNEFTPLFQKNMTKFDATVFGGNFDTYGGEGVVTAVYDRLSLSAGAYGYNSSGWRANNGLNQHIYNVFAQYALTDTLNVQAELRRRESDEGDLSFNFNRNDFVQQRSIGRDLDTARIGLRYTLSPRSNFIFSYIYGDRGESRLRLQPLPVGDLSVASSAADQGHQFEGQYIYQRDLLSFIAGFGYGHVDRQRRAQITAPGFAVDDSVEQTIKNPRGYAYLNIKLSKSLTSTLGLGYEDYQAQPIALSSLNPKFGLQWDVRSDLRLRAAVFRSGRSTLVNNRTIEPTQVAGFNQLFDDVSGVTSWRYGAGADWRISPQVSIGTEITWRELDEPVLDNSGQSERAVLEKRTEALHSAYMFCTPGDRVSVRAQFIYDLYKSQTGLLSEFDNLPVRSETLSAPLTVTYFHPNGFYAALGGTMVSQSVVRAPAASQTQGSDSFFLVDTSVGYRLPHRLGSLSVAVKNLFDTDFDYQDDSYREFRDEPSTGPYFPERTVLARVSLNF